MFYPVERTQRTMVETTAVSYEVALFKIVVLDRCFLLLITLKKKLFSHGATCELVADDLRL